MTQDSSSGGHDDFLHDIHFGSTFLNEGTADSLFTLRYNQKPASMDAAQSGTLWADTTTPGSLFAAFPSSSKNDMNNHEHYYSGKIEPAKEVDCMLIWDESLQSFSLERVDANVHLNVDRNGSHHKPPIASASKAKATAPKPKPPAAHQVLAAHQSRLPQTSGAISQSTRTSSSDSSDLEVVTSISSTAQGQRHSQHRGNGLDASAIGRSNDGPSLAASAAKTGSRGPPSAREPEVEDFGDVSFGGSGKVVAAAQAPTSTSEQDKVIRSSPTKDDKAIRKDADSSAATATISSAGVTQRVLPPSSTVSPQKPTKPAVQTSPKLGSAAGAPLTLPARSSPGTMSGTEVEKTHKPVASKRPPTSTSRVASKSPSKTIRSAVASKVPSSAADPVSPNKKNKRSNKSTVASKVPAKMPLSKATISSSEGSSDDNNDDVASSDSSNSASGSEEEDDGIPEGYLVRPGSVLSAGTTGATRNSSSSSRNGHSAVGGSGAGVATKRPPMKTIPSAATKSVAAATAHESGSSSSDDSASDDEDEESDMDSLATDIVSTFQGPGSVRKGMTQAGGGIGKGKGGPKRASKIPASMRSGTTAPGGAAPRPLYASKIPASMSGGGSRIGRGKGGAKAPRKGLPQTGSAGHHGPGSSTGFNTSPQLQQPEDDVPDSSEED